MSLEEIIKKVEKARAEGKKVNTQHMVDLCIKNQIPPPTMFREAAQKGLMGVFR